MKDEVVVLCGRGDDLHVLVLDQPLAHLLLHQQDLRLRAVGEGLLNELAGGVQVRKARLKLVALFA